MGQAQDLHLSCVADTPLEEKQDDHLDAQIYARALAAFIRTADTPFTIGIQGGWGSGKSSLFSLIKARLQPKPKGASGEDAEQKGTSRQDAEQKDASAKDAEKPVPCIAVNAWEQSLFQGDAGPALVAVNLLQDIITKIHELPNDNRLSLTPDAVTNINNCDHDIQGTLATLRRVVLATAQIGLTLLTQKDMSGAIKLATGGEDPVQDSPATQIRNLRTKLTGLVNCLPATSGTARLVIFIDDLDRVSPPAAVEILDVLKNIFNIPGCVFVLAIDYDVVIKGLEAKLGPRTGKNTHEFRQYLDKIIQVPFTMPVEVFSQNNGKFIRHLFEKVLPLKSDGKEISADTRESLEEIFRLTTGGNPRSVKRILNTFLLLDHIQAEKNPVLASDIRKLPLEARVLVVALHLNFPEICARLAERPDFIRWSLVLDESWNLDFEHVKKKLSALEQNAELGVYFSEEWQKVVYCLCAKTDWLKHNVVNIVRLLLLLRQLLQKVGDAKDARSDKLPTASLFALRSFLEDIRIFSDKTTGESDRLLPASFLAWRSFIEDIRVFSDKNTGEDDDYITNYMRKIYEGLKSKFPDLKFGKPPKQAVAKENHEKINTLESIGEVNIIYIYSVPLEEKFENFSMHLYNDLYTICLEYIFEFTLPHPSPQNIEEFLSKLANEANEPLPDGTETEGEDVAQLESPGDMLDSDYDDADQVNAEQWAAWDTQDEAPPPSTTQEERFESKVRGNKVVTSLSTTLMDEIEDTRADVRGCIMDAEKACTYALKVRQALEEYARNHQAG